MVEAGAIRKLRLGKGRWVWRDYWPRIVRLSNYRAAAPGQFLTGSSGREIIEILKRNPKKDPSKYEEEDIAHMRKVVSYNKRHLAQEEKAKQDTNSKSYKSLKNWGHDALKD